MLHLPSNAIRITKNVQEMTPFVLLLSACFRDILDMDDALMGDLIYIFGFCLGGLVFALGPIVLVHLIMARKTRNYAQKTEQYIECGMDPIGDAWIRYSAVYYLYALVFVAFGIYFGWFWAKGQTLAMKTWHIRVVDRHGNALTQGRALWRYVLSWVWLLPPLAVGGIMHLPGPQLTVLFVGSAIAFATLMAGLFFVGLATLH